MMYKPSPEAWMEFLYGEMEAEEMEKMKRYLAENPEAEAELRSLQQTQTHIQSVPVPQAPEPPQILHPQKAKIVWYQSRWLHAVAAGIALMFAAKLIGVQMKYQDKTFSIQFGTPPASDTNKELEEKIALLETQNNALLTQNKNDSLFQAVFQLGSALDRLEEQNKSLAQRVSNSSLNEKQLASLKTELGEANYQMVLNMLTETQEYQKAYTDELLVNFSQFLEQQRQQDLKLMEVAFNHIIEQNDLQQEETQYLLTELMTQLSD